MKEENLVLTDVLVIIMVFQKMICFGIIKGSYVLGMKCLEGKDRYHK
jgi:hypothetical protein